MIDRSAFHKFDRNGYPTSVIDYRIFEYLSKQTSMFILGSVPYLYRDGVYKADINGSGLKTAIRELIYPELIRSTTIDRIYKLFISADELQAKAEDLNQYPVQWINFQNGMYDPVKKALFPHDPKYRAVNQIPHRYEPEAFLHGDNVEQWLQFIVSDPDDREMLLQFCGLCLTRDTRQQKFLILTGEGGSGKSTVIRLIEMMIGSENISNISMKDLSQRFASYGLLWKLLNSCADLEVSALEDTSVLKKILGEDSIRAEAKGKDAISFKSNAKLIFSTNELPVILNERTNGFYRRLLILPMNRQPKEKRADFIECLEQEYFLQLSVKALERLYQAGVICESFHSKDAVKQLRMDSDSVEAWLYDDMQKESTSKLERTYLYERYERYCLQTDRAKLTRHNFYKSLKMKGYAERKIQGYRYFEGISTKESAPDCP